MHLAAARIFVHDLAAARDFYRDALGLKLEYDGGELGFCKFTSAGIQIILEQVASTDRSEDKALVGRFLGLSFATANVRAEFERLRAQGVHFIGHPEVQHWGGKLVTLQDPSGNQFQLVQYPASDA